MDVLGGPEILLYGGARGGGKTFWVLAQIYDDCYRFPGLKVLWLRKVAKKAREGLDDVRRRVLSNVPHQAAANGTIKFPNGSMVLVGHFRTERDIDDYLGLEYDVIVVEEASTLTKSKLRAIGTCCRTSKPGWRPRQYYTTNPGGVSHAHLKETFIKPYRRKSETVTRFIPATVDDNRFVNPEYVGVLNRLTGWQRAAWRLGDWDIDAGEFFSTWSEAHHVRPSTIADPHWTYWLAMDYGFVHPTVWGLFGMDQEGIRWLIEEYGEARRTVEAHSDEVKFMLSRHNLSLDSMRQIVGSPDAFAKRGDDGRSIVEAYAEHDIRITPAKNDRIMGAGEILRLLGDPANEERATPARLQIMDRCVMTIEQIPAMQHDPNRPEDVLKVDIDDDDGTGGDDYYDMSRYGVMAVARDKGEDGGYSPGVRRRERYVPG